VAFELAHQLAREGAAISLLALFGSPYPSHFRLPAQARQRASEKLASFFMLMRDLGTRSPLECRRYLADRLRQRRSRMIARQAAALDPVLALRAKLEKVTVAAVRAYEPRLYAGRVALFLPSWRWAQSDGWRGAAPRAELHAGPGCGSQDMLREPNAAAFAALLEDALGSK
jgi:thioesterase domain-containing protein